jgi:hypothetical protein
VNNFDKQEIFLLPETQFPDFIQEASDPSKSLMLIVQEQDTGPEMLESLSRICQAAGFDFGTQVSILRTSPDDELSVSNLFDIRPGQSIISFGTHDESLVTQFHKIKYWWIDLNGESILFTDPLSDLLSSKERKVKLWNALQEKFKTNP